MGLGDNIPKTISVVEAFKRTLGVYDERKAILKQNTELHQNKEEKAVIVITITP